MSNLTQHALKLRGVLVLGAASDLAEAERTQRAEVTGGLADPTSNLRDLHGAHAVASSAISVAGSPRSAATEASGSSSVLRAPARDTGNTSATVFPRSWATSSGRTSRRKPLT